MSFINPPYLFFFFFNIIPFRTGTLLLCAAVGVKLSVERNGAPAPHEFPESLWDTCTSYIPLPFKSRQTVNSRCVFKTQSYHGLEVHFKFFPHYGVFYSECYKNNTTSNIGTLCSNVSTITYVFKTLKFFSKQSYLIDGLVRLVRLGLNIKTEKLKRDRTQRSGKVLCISLNTNGMERVLFVVR